MHKSLEIFEVLGHIFQNVDSNATLASLARTCSSFTDPALRVLWRKQINLVALIRVMPSDLWRIDEWEAPSGRHLLKFTRPLHRLDWSRFDYYGRKIEELHISPLSEFRVSSVEGTYIHKGVFIDLMSYRPVRQFLPNLRVLRWWSHNDPGVDRLPFFQGLLGTSLSSLYLDWQTQDDEHIAAFLLSVSRTSPDLRNLTLQTSPEPVVAIALNDLLLNLEGLETLDVKNLFFPPRVVHHLGTLDSFSSWREASFSSDATELLSLETDRNTFLHLRKFEFIAPDPLIAAAIVNSMACPLENIKITCSSRPDMSTRPLHHLHRLTDAFMNHRCSPFLSDLSIEIMHGITAHTQSVTQVLAPLFSLHAISRMKLVSNAVLDLDDAWLEEASTSWPLLSTLHLTCPKRLAHGHPRATNPVMTLAGLVPVTKKCPSLRSLSVTLTASTFDPVLLCGDYNPLLTKTEFINFPCSSIKSNPVPLFRCLIILFPNLKIFRGYGLNDPADEGWKILKKLFAEITTGR